jgi:hypothetical protein
VEGAWRREGHGGIEWQVSGGRGRPVVSGLHGDGYPDRRAEDITKCGADAGAWEQNGGALGFLITAARFGKRFWWAGWYAVVEKEVADCLACRLRKMKRSRRQAKCRSGTRRRALRRLRWMYCKYRLHLRLE